MALNWVPAEIKGIFIYYINGFNGFYVEVFSVLMFKQTIYTALFTSSSLLRHHQLLGGHIHPAHKQRPEPHPVHADHAAFQRDHPAGVGELQAEEASAQRSAASSPVAHLAGDVAPAGEQPRPRRGAPTAGNTRHDTQTHPCGKRQ